MDATESKIRKTKQMKQSEVLANVMAGGIFCVGTYLSGKLDTVSMRDKQNPGGPRRTGYVAKETIITDTEPVIISRWLKEEEKPEAWKPSAVKKQQVIVRVKEMEMMSGIPILNGVMEVLLP